MDVIVTSSSNVQIIQLSYNNNYQKMNSYEWRIVLNRETSSVDTYHCNI